MKKLIGAVALATVCGAAQAAPVTTGVWYDVRWQGSVGTQLFGGPGYSVFADPGDAPWTITIGAGGATLTVLDLFAAGDRFSVFDGGNLIGDTSPVPDVGGNCGEDIAACLADPGVSRGIFVLAPGSYSFTMTLLQDALVTPGGTPFSSGAAGFRIDAGTTVIPVPPAAALLLSGLVGLGWLGRRRRG